MKTGVYLLLSKRRVIYVGATTQWPIRLAAHKGMSFTDAKIFECPQQNLLEYEKRFIAMFNPIHNVMGTNRRVHKKMTDAWIIDNAASIKNSTTRSETRELVKKARAELNYSSRYGSSDLERCIITNYERLFKVSYDYKKKKFVKV